MSSSVGVPTRHLRGFAVAEGTPAGEGEANAARPVIVCDCRDLPFKTRRQSQRAVCVGSREPGVPTTVIWSAGSAGHDDASASVSPDARVRRLAITRALSARCSRVAGRSSARDVAAPYVTLTGAIA